MCTRPAQGPGGEVGVAVGTAPVASNVFAASGPGLHREQAGAEEPAKDEPAATATTVPASTTGTLKVSTCMCPEAPTESDAYDWIGACHLLNGSADHDLNTVSSDAEVTGSGATTATGELTFADLESGIDRLERTDATWCNAESDDVTSEGDVVITAGERSTRVDILL